MAVWAELNQESISSMDHRYWTYIVASLSGTLYIGRTNNIERRIWEYKGVQEWDL
jgi:predicted GIY-YIG superfamily endonuclease